MEANTALSQIWSQIIKYVLLGRRVGILYLLTLTSASEAASTSDTLLELLDLDNLGCIDALEDKLGNAVTLLDLKVGLVVVEKKDLDLATVIGIDDTSTCVDKVLGGET
jgi:hypothetical protein